MAASLARPIANRAVHLRITPRPSNLGESREIMRLISQFGEIEYFKSLKYDASPVPNAALVIYKDEKAAEECLQRSPIRFRMQRVRARPQAELQDVAEDTMQEPSAAEHIEHKSSRERGATAWGHLSIQSRHLSTSSLPTPPPNPIRMPFDPAPSPDPPMLAEEDSRIFQIITNRSNRHFRDQVNAGHYHGSFAIDPKMPGQEDLAKKVPLVGLSCVDWKASERPWRVLGAEKIRMASKGSLGKLARESKGIFSEREDVLESFEADMPRAENTETIRGVNADSFESFAAKDLGTESERVESSETDTVSAILKGWDTSGASPKQRYSGRPK